MNAARQIEPEKISILQLKTKRGSIEEGDNPGNNPIQGYTFNFEVGTGMRPEDLLVGIELGIEIVGIDEFKNPVGATGSYTHEIVFKVDNLEEFLEKTDENSSTKVDSLLISTLMGIAYSTIRGIIFTRTQATSLGAVILPILDPKKLTQMAFPK